MSGSVSSAAHCLLAVAAAMGSVVSSAQELEQRERASLVLGVFVTEPEISARVDSSISNAGTDIDFGRDLGLEPSATIARLGGYFWFADRHRLDAAWFSLSLDGERSIDETIDFGDERFAIHTLVDTRTELDIAQVSYTFAAIARERGFLGLSAGAHVSKTAIDLTAPWMGGESEEVTAPLPVIGVRADWRFAGHWTLRTAWQWFGIEVDGTDGHLTDAYVAVDYGFLDRFAVGLALNDTGLDVEQQRTISSRSVNWGYNGWMLYFKTDFAQRSQATR